MFGLLKKIAMKRDDFTMIVTSATLDAEKFSTYLPHTVGRYNSKRFHKAYCPLVERLVCGLMMHGRNNGKKLKAISPFTQIL